MKHLFPDFPDDARVWVYALSKPLQPADRELVTGRLEAFLREWQSHGTPVVGASAIVEDRFVLISGYVPDGISGCSTDASVRVMKELREKDGIDGFDRSLVFFRDANGAVQSVKRPDFKVLVDAGQVVDDTAVFDTTIQFIGDLRRGGFETTFGKSWHATAFS